MQSCARAPIGSPSAIERLEETPMDYKNFPRDVQRGFLIWTWIALLGAFTASSGVFATQSYLIANRGFETLRFGSAIITTYALLLPIICLIVGWLSFLQYSLRLIDRILFLEGDGSGHSPSTDADMFRLRFTLRNSLLFLFFSWLTILFVAMVPYFVRVL